MALLDVPTLQSSSVRYLITQSMLTRSGVVHGLVHTTCHCSELPEYVLHIVSTLAYMYLRQIQLARLSLQQPLMSHPDAAD